MMMCRALPCSYEEKDDCMEYDQLEDLNDCDDYYNDVAPSSQKYDKKSAVVESSPSPPKDLSSQASVTKIVSLRIGMKIFFSKFMQTSTNGRCF